MHEFDLIHTYFAASTSQRADVQVGIGDDAAIVRVPPNHELVITTDTLVAGVHFADDALPQDIGHKALAVNLSDLAAMGATPAWVTLALTLPNADEAWLQTFCQGFFTLANRYHLQLIGGDMTHGPLSITIQAMGFVPTGNALLRSGAQPNDLIYVTGTLGDAGLALANPHQRALSARLHRPEPRIEVGQRLLGIAHAAIDISDGLAADLTHLLEASHVGARVVVDQLPLSQQDALPFALTAGDDYELCFTIPPNKRAELEQALSTLDCAYTCIGEITQQPGLDLRYHDGKKYHGPTHGYQHF